MDQKSIQTNQNVADIIPAPRPVATILQNQENRGGGVFSSMLNMLTRDFPCDFTVKKGGEEIHMSINGNCKLLVLKSDRTWDYQ